MMMQMIFGIKIRQKKGEKRKRHPAVNKGNGGRKGNIIRRYYIIKRNYIRTYFIIKKHIIKRYYIIKKQYRNI